jgi:hypothetical protein
MPLGRYLAFTASLLLALLFIADRYMPKLAPEAMRADVDRSIIRIHSGHKWPDAVVIDTSLPTITPPQAIAASVPAKTLPRDAFAQLPQAPLPARPASMTEPRSAGSRHPVKTARAAVRRVASYQATEFRSVVSHGW